MSTKLIDIDTPESTPQRQQQPPAPSLAAPAAVAATVKSAASATYEELKDQLAKAENTIASLRTEVASGLRQRKAAGTSSEGETSKAPQLAQQQPQGRATEGVPVQIVALLCLVSFLLAYFFF